MAIAILERVMKTCIKCGQEKSTDEFHKNKTSKGGFQRWCKICAKVHRQKYQQTHSIEIAKRQKEYQQTIEGFLRKCFGNLKYRCNNPNGRDYHCYGGRGIECRFEDADDFICYVMGVLGYNMIEKLEGLQIDRIENDGHYEMGNIQFVTAKVNANNRRNSIR